MKKLFICAAVVAAGLFASSCKDTNYCWEVTTTGTIAGIEVSTTNYYWATQNELDAIVADIKAGSKEAIQVTYKRTSKANEECHK